MIVLDVDGTMTNGNITYDTQDNEYKSLMKKMAWQLLVGKKLEKKLLLLQEEALVLFKKEQKS